MTKKIGLIFSLSALAAIVVVAALGLTLGEQHVPLILSIAVGAFFVALVVLVLTYGRKPIYPEGKRHEVALSGYKAIVIVSHYPISDHDLVTLGHHCAEALLEVGRAWRASGIVINGVTEPRKSLSGHVFHFMNDTDYENAWRGDLKLWGMKTAGVRGQLPIIGGGGPFIAAIRASLIHRVLNRSTDIVIHEPVHTMRLWDPFHMDEQVWMEGAQKWNQSNPDLKPLDPNDTVEGRALKAWQH